LKSSESVGANKATPETTRGKNKARGKMGRKAKEEEGQEDKEVQNSSGRKKNAHLERFGRTR
jgi:hypothetical protein